MKKQPVIVLSHGSKSEEAIDDFHYIVETMKEKSGNLEIYGAQMEMAEPSLEEVVSELAPQEPDKVIIVPYFLYNGNHIKKDIPAKIEKLKERYPGITFEFLSPIGKEPLMADIMLKKFNAAGHHERV